jgi:hypothetical protein
MRKSMGVILGLVASLGALPGVSNATCTLTGQIVRITAYSDAYSATAGYIYFRPSSLASYYYSVSTTDDEMVGVAQGHMESGRTVTIQGDVAACPAVPAPGGAASIGGLNYIYNP